MAQAVTMKVEGLRSLGEAMRTLKDEVARKIARSMTGTAAGLVKKAAVENIIRSPSVDTGSLRDAVIVKRETKTDLTSEHLVTVRRKASGRKTKTKQSTAPHAIFVEFGTVNMPAEPFLRPALENNVRQATEAMREKGKKGVEAAARKAARAK